MEAKLDVINSLTEAPPRPPDAVESQVATGGGGQTPGAASLLIRVLLGEPIPFNSDQAAIVPDTDWLHYR